MTIHLIEPGARTYITDVIARCGVRVSRDEERRTRDLPVDCAKCTALEAEDDAAIEELLNESSLGEPSQDETG